MRYLSINATNTCEIGRDASKGRSWRRTSLRTGRWLSLCTLIVDWYVPVSFLVSLVPDSVDA